MARTVPFTYNTLPLFMTPTVPYTNDAHADIAYHLIFNYLSLQKRIKLRIICQRWKRIIEADCAQMSTLRVFGVRFNFLDEYLRQTEYLSIVPSTFENPFKYDPSPFNTLILKRPALDRVDIHFLARLFPAISNLALAWTFGETTQEFEKILENGKRAKFKVSSVHEPDIFALLETWAPTLHSLDLVTSSYAPKFIHGDWRQSFHIEDLDANQIPAFWRCLSLMAPTLQKLTFDGVDLRSALQWLTMPALEEVINYNPAQNISPEELNRMAPALQSYGLPFTVDICPLVLPATVKRMIIFFLSDSSLWGDVTPCPSIIHLKVELYRMNRNQDPVDLFTKLLAKFPNITSLTIFDGDMLHGWLIEKGKELGTMHQPAGTFGDIEELTLKTVTIDILKSTSNEEDDDRFVYFFRGISVQFKGLKKLTLAIEPDSEVRHRKLKEMLTYLKGQCIPKVELEFALDMNYEDRKLPFIVQSEGAEACALDLSLCCLSPGCVFAPISQPN